MSKKKRQEDNEDRLERENRELKALNRSLLKQLKKKNKGRFKEDISFEPEYEEETPKPKVKICGSCGKGELSQTKVRHLIFEVCNICEHREKVNG